MAGSALQGQVGLFTRHVEVQHYKCILLQGFRLQVLYSQVATRRLAVPSDVLSDRLLQGKSFLDTLAHKTVQTVQILN